jgi:hypothetical protein
MPKTKISEFSATPANNTDIDSINIAEGCAPSGINDAIRELMAQLKDFQTGAVGDSFNGPVGTTTAAAGAFTTLSASSTATLSGLTASTALALDASKNIVSVTNTGTGSNVLATSPTLVTPILGTPTSATLTNATGLPIATGVSGLGTGIATALAVNTGSAGAPVLFNGALGTPSSGTATNLTGLPLTTGVTGTLPTANGGTNLTSFTSGGVVYASSSSALATSSALTFNGSTLSTTGNIQVQLTKSFFAYTSDYGIGTPDSSGLQIFYGLSDSLRFGTRNSGTFTETMRLTETSLYTASGINVGFGTSSPQEKLQVNGAILTTGSLSAVRTSAASLDFLSGNTRFISMGADASTKGGFIWYNSTNAAVTEGMRLDSSGNLGLGVTPNTWTLGKSFSVGDVGSAVFGFGGYNSLTSGAYFNSGWKYSSSSSSQKPALFVASDGAFSWSTAAAGTAGNAISFTQAMTLDASGNLMVGATSSSAIANKNIDVNGTGDAALVVRVGGTTTSYLYSTAGTTILGTASTIPLVFNTNNAERARISSDGTFRVKGAGTAGSTDAFQVSGSATASAVSIDSSGNLLVGTTSSSFRFVVANSSASAMVYVGPASLSTSGGENAADAMMKFRADSTTTRSINAAGTINASGADYAEYMTKASDFNVAKGDVVGVDSQGKLTNVFSNAISFVVKSTNPSYVGGDTWGSGFDDDAEGLEAARQLVDRIAFSGQVPVNVFGAIAGQYIIPINDNGAIKGQAVSNPTFEQYQSSVGKVIAIEADGRARIIVKVA